MNQEIDFRRYFCLKNWKLFYILDLEFDETLFQNLFFLLASDWDRCERQLKEDRILTVEFIDLKLLLILWQ